MIIVRSVPAQNFEKKPGGSQRFRTYRVPDHYLQWQIADNFFQGKSLEKHFNLNDKGLWSAGDRPMLLAFLTATMSRLFDVHQLLDYMLRTIFFATFLLPALHAFLKVEFGIQKKPQLIALLLPVMLSPFFVLNFFFTWPKMLGLAFGMMGLLFFAIAAQQKSRFSALLSGAAFALGALCHTAAIFCVLAAILYFLMKGLKVERPGGWVAALKMSLFALLPFILLMGIHSAYVKTHTSPTGLLSRVQICREGSYAFWTPRKPLSVACREYYERAGLSGIIADRVESMRKGFFHGYDEFALITPTTPLSIEGVIGFIRQMDPLMQARPFLSNGIYFLPTLIVSVLLVIWSLISRSEKSSPIFKANLLLPIAAFSVVGFSAILGEHSEMASHVLPYTVPLLSLLGTLLCAWSLTPKLLYIVSALLCTWSLLANWFRIPVEALLTPGTYHTALMAYAASVLCVLAFDFGSKPITDKVPSDA